jgi:hypothetical protein
MAILTSLVHGARIPVPSRLLIGRAAHCALSLPEAHVSSEHAVLAWDGSRWTLRDLGSRNGTFVNGERASAGATLNLAPGARLALGTTDATWLLEDDGAPAPMASAGDGPTRVIRTGADGLLPLPTPEDPQVIVASDGRGSWFAELDGRRTPVADGAEIAVADRTWRLHLPTTQVGTAVVDAGPTLDTIRLQFTVSRDEEHVGLTVIHRGREIKLEGREHNYVLLTLARARLDDRLQPAAEQGWVDRDRLLRMLGLDHNGLNVAIYRARGHLASVVDGAADVVEVRRGQRRIGVEPERLTVLRP